MEVLSNEEVYFKLFEKIKIELKQIEFMSSDCSVQEKVHKLLELIEGETINEKEILAALIKEKIKETKGINSELNMNFYLLYRRLVDNKITCNEAKDYYFMYKKELEYF